MSIFARVRNAILSKLDVLGSATTFLANIFAVVWAVYRGAPAAPLAYSTAFQAALFLALSLLSAFFSTYWVARFSIRRQAAAILRMLHSDTLYESNIPKAVEAIQSGIALVGIMSWTVLLILTVLALNIQRGLWLAAILLWLIGLTICTQGVRTFNRMLHPDIGDDLAILVVEQAELAARQRTSARPHPPERETA